MSDLVEILNIGPVVIDKRGNETQYDINGAAIAMSQAAARIEELEARVRELDWISVEDRLPEEDGPYLCVIDWGKSKEVKSLWRIDDAWFCHGHNYPEVIKWRPLPKAE